MSEKNIKRIRRQIRKRSDEIRIQGLRQFVNFLYSKPFPVRFVYCMRLAFRRVKP